MHKLKQRAIPDRGNGGWMSVFIYVKLNETMYIITHYIPFKNFPPSTIQYLHTHTYILSRLKKKMHFTRPIKPVAIATPQVSLFLFYFCPHTHTKK